MLGSTPDFRRLAPVTGTIYAIGGHDADNTALSTVELLYTGGNHQWKTGPSLKTPRYGHSSAVYNGLMQGLRWVIDVERAEGSTRIVELPVWRASFLTFHCIQYF